MAHLLPRLRAALPLRACALQPVASTSKALLSSSGRVLAPQEDPEEELEEDAFDLGDLAARARRDRPTASPKRGQTLGKEGSPSSKDAGRFQELFARLNTSVKDDARPAQTLDRSALNELLSLAVTRAHFSQIFELCTRMRARAVPVERFYASDFYDRCIRYDTPRIALKVMASAVSSGLPPTSMTHVWGVLERLRASLKPEDKEDCAAALKSAFLAVTQLEGSGLVASDPLLTTQLMAICLRVGSEEALELFKGLEKDVRAVNTPTTFGRAYFETRSLHLSEVSTYIDRSLTAVRDHLNGAGAEAGSKSADFWESTFSLIDSVRSTGDAPGSGPVWRRAALTAPGIERGKYGGPVRKNVPYGTPMHRIATVDGKPVSNPHLLDVLARSRSWAHGKRADP